MPPLSRALLSMSCLALWLTAGCVKFIMPPKPHVGALPPAAVLEQGETYVGMSYDTFSSQYYDYDLPTQSILGRDARIEARHVFAGAHDVGDLGGYVSGYSFGLDGGYWFRPDKRSETRGRWAFRLAPSLTFGNFMGVDAPTRNLMPGLGAGGAVQRAKRLADDRFAYSVTGGAAFAFAAGVDYFSGEGRVYWPMLCFELQNRWDFGRPEARLGGYAALGFQFTWVMPSAVVSGGLRF